jgi:hypothetical protein
MRVDPPSNSHSATTMNKALIAVLALIAVAGITFGVIEMGGGSDQQARIDQLTAELDKAQKDLAERLKQLHDLDALRSQVASLTAEKEELEKQLKEMRANAEKNAGIASADKPDGAGNKPSLADRNSMSAMARGFFKNLDDPAFKEAMKANSLRQISAAYGPLFKKLGLDDDTAKLAADLIADRGMEALQKGRKLVEGGAASEGAMGDVRKDVESVKADYDVKLKSVLGEQKFTEFNTYEQTMGDQRSLDRMSQSFEKSGAPLQQEQRDSLANIMREERLKSPSNEIPDLGGGPGMAILMSDTEAKAQQQAEEDYANRVVNRASQAGLSPDQVNVLQDSFKQRNQNRTMGRAMGRMFIGGMGGR